MNKKHLTINDICIGDYVQEWLEIPGKWGTPLYIDGIFGNGDVYLDLVGNEADPFDSNVRDIYDIPIDFEILSHFGFNETDLHRFQMKYEEWNLIVDVYRSDEFTVRALATSEGVGVKMSNSNLSSIRSLQHWFYETTGKPLKLDFN